MLSWEETLEEPVLSYLMRNTKEPDSGQVNIIERSHPMVMTRFALYSADNISILIMFGLFDGLVCFGTSALHPFGVVESIIVYIGP